MTRTLYLIRHGTTEDNHLKRYPAADSPLSAQGKRAVQKLQPFLPSNSVVLSSPSLRTLQTCGALGLSPVIHPDLREMDFGIMAGHTWAELEAKHGNAPLQWLEDMQNPESAAGAPQGESGKAFASRIAGVLRDLPEGNTILVTHLGVIRAILRQTLNLQRFELSPASLTVLKHDGEWILKHLNIAFSASSIRSVFISGGARSGKSAFAEKLAAEQEGEITFIATAQAFDEEMQDRIARHQTDRPEHFKTLEAPRELLEAVEKVYGPLLIDCLSLWVSNLMMQEMTEAAILERAQAICEVIQQRTSPTIVVSNEVGLGIVPVNKLARQYRDILGRVNQMFSQACQESYFCVAGQPIKVK
ncbi:bifunctional adenosylcobinamide kinase/adenosylcobinamide-phosphate guanylyltransferase [Deinococcus cellulosilyticus]|uniref:Adenosylcobinamide kinase n=1 Tax=Deinococcus cellulosilyticus (strain DSM 18568 / NBRC 106333 / KACC 11606 / 5516J-15) TaxID=1223518 RepID=A0A511NAE4_DEIC1|nr:bifunctional adenosylcobinamide kinase/adenosylcobinamide-phosphate guanylyltransferase [Deinococcus cellulosilyticus]GEM49506.1 hypothetical protein DC3_51410 [Deinococcus cellulosilyticus NBRC 106333 = KACC 11606]